VQSRIALWPDKHHLVYSLEGDITIDVTDSFVKGAVVRISAPSVRPHEEGQGGPAR
jgi:hypothetical protein